MDEKTSQHGDHVETKILHQCCITLLTTSTSFLAIPRGSSRLHGEAKDVLRRITGPYGKHTMTCLIPQCNDIMQRTHPAVRVVFLHLCIYTLHTLIL